MPLAAPSPRSTIGAPMEFGHMARCPRNATGASMQEGAGGSAMPQKTKAPHQLLSCSKSYLSLLGIDQQRVSDLSVRRRQASEILDITSFSFNLPPDHLAIAWPRRKALARLSKSIQIVDTTIAAEIAGRFFTKNDVFLGVGVEKSRLNCACRKDYNIESTG